MVAGCRVRGSGLKKSAKQNVQLVQLVLLVETKMFNWFNWFYWLKPRCSIGPIGFVGCVQLTGRGFIVELWGLAPPPVLRFKFYVLGKCHNARAMMPFLFRWLTRGGGGGYNFMQ